MLIVLKFAAIVASGLFGFFALLGDNRTKSGRFTIWGRVAISGVIVSTLIAAITQAIESKKAREADIETQQMVTEIRRAAYPLVPTHAPTFSYSVELPLKHPSLAAYRERLKKMTESVRSHTDSKTEWPDTSANVSTEIPSGNKTVIGLIFTQKSPAFPQPDSEPALLDWLTHFGIDIYCYQRGSSSPRFGAGRRPDVEMRQLSPASDFQIFYYLDTDRLEINASGGLEEGRLWASTGAIVSLADLPGAEMTVEFRDEDRDDALDTIRLEIEKDARLGSLSFNISNRRFFIGRLNSVPGHTYPTYSYTLPANLLSADVNLPSK